jgi:putative ABC transport system permease protein
MILYYLKIALRGIKKHAAHTAISVTGLAIGLATYVLLMNYTSREKTFDTWHKDADKTYRVESWFKRNGQVTDFWASSTFGYAPAMKKEFPEIRDVVRVDNYDCERVVRYEQRAYREAQVVFADSNFFRFFSYPLLRGDTDRVLREPNSIAISESAARKYFGREDPMGKILHISTIKKKYDCAVTGVFKDFPSNSVLHLDLIMSYMTTVPWEREYWYMHEAYTYVKVNTAADVRSIEARFPALAERYKTAPALKEHQWGVSLIPLSEIHLNPLKPYELEDKGSRSTINMLSVIAYLVLLISWINYINLFISSAMEKAGEIGIRKMAGASWRHVYVQFLTEAMLTNLLSLILFFALMIGGAYFFEGFWSSSLTWIASLLVFVAGTLVTESIPALVLRNLNMAEILKNKLSFRSGTGEGLRRSLIVFQYFCAFVLIVSTLTIRKQMLFMQSGDLGFSSAQTLILQTPPKTDSLYESKMLLLTQQLRTLKDVGMVSRSSAVPGKMAGYGMANRRVGDPDNTGRMCEMVRVDHDFLPAYGLHFIRGRNFSRSYALDSTDNVIITENAMHLFGFRKAEEAMQGAIHLEGHKDKQFRIIGVTSDYHQQSLKEDYRPIVFLVFNPWGWIDNHFISLRLDPTANHETVEHVQAVFSNLFPQSSFDFFFLDDYFNRQYRQDLQYGRLIMILSLLALFIVGLGIVGMTSFMLLRRKKEIGIRKVSGAGTIDILRLLNTHFLKMVGVAFILAIPVAWIGMHSWLQNFANRTAIGGLVFMAAAAISGAVTILTVSIRSYTIASKNPIESLRYE